MPLSIAPTSRPVAALPSRAAVARRTLIRVRAEADGAAEAKVDPTVCASCGVKLSEAPKGCDGKGRVAGGMGAVVDWWPIKAYRECPALISSGKQYTRKGQITDEMLFGRTDTDQTRF